MSDPSSPIDAETEELEMLFGGPMPELQRDPTETEIAVLTGRIRGQLAEAAQQEHLGIREIARDLGVSPSAVSRHLRSDGDIRVSTMVILARALHRRWTITLDHARPAGNFFVQASYGPGGALAPTHPPATGTGAAKTLTGDRAFGQTATQAVTY